MCAFGLMIRLHCILSTKKELSCMVTAVEQNSNIGIYWLLRKLSIIVLEYLVIVTTKQTKIWCIFNWTRLSVWPHGMMKYDLRCENEFPFYCWNAFIVYSWIRLLISWTKLCANYKDLKSSDSTGNTWSCYVCVWCILCRSMSCI